VCSLNKMLVGLLTITEAAGYADVSRHTIYTWMNPGIRYRGRLYSLDGVTHLGKTFIRLKTLDAFLDQIGYEQVDDEE